MKRYGNLFEKIIDKENLKLAHKNAKHGKRDQTIITTISENLEFYCNEIRNNLLSKKFTTSQYEIFTLNDNGKERKIYKLPYYPDRIIQHAIMQVVEPIWKKTLIADTYQAIKGRGVHKCITKLKKVVQSETEPLYCLQVDVKKFYPSIPNWLLRQVVRRKIKCKDTLWLLDDIIDSCSEVPIGNYISQYFGNLALSSIDHKIKEVYRLHHYFRYCDDLIILHTDKQLLHSVRAIISQELKVKGLKMKSNYQVFKICDRKGIDFLGFVVYKHKVLLRRKIVNNFKRIAKYGTFDDVPTIMSYYGWTNFCNGRNLWVKYVKIFLNKLTEEEKKNPVVKSLYKKLQIKGKHNDS